MKRKTKTANIYLNYVNEVDALVSNLIDEAEYLHGYSNMREAKLTLGDRVKKCKVTVIVEEIP